MLLIFDFDGTLADSLEINIQVMNKFLTRFNKPLITKKEVRENGGLAGLIKSRNIKKWQIPLLVYLGRRELKKLLLDIAIFPGLAQTLKKLAVNHTLGILTSNSAENVEQFLKYNNLSKYFDFIKSDNSLTGKHIKLLKIVSKYKLEHQKTAYIADETRDILAAKKAGIISIAVTWGFESKQSLMKVYPDMVLSSPADLEKI